MSQTSPRDRLRLPSFRHLSVFEAVAARGNLSRAAAEVNMSQPSVTQAVKKVEAWAGATLFQRGSTGTYLTNEGRIFFDCVRRLFDRAAAALETGPLRGTARQAIRLAMLRLKAAHINVLAAVVETHSFENAALALGLSRASVQRTAREFEAIVKRDLYRRTSRGLVATSVAVDLSLQLLRACQELLEGMQEIALIGDAQAISIFIGAQPLASRTLLAAAIEGVLRDFPAARVRIIEGTYPYLLQELRSGRIDLMFGGLQCPSTIDDVVEEPLFDDPYCVVVRAGHPLCAREPVLISDLAAVDWVLPGPGSQRRSAFNQLFRDQPRRPTTSIDTTSVTAQIAILICSDRATLLTRAELALDGWTAGLVELPLATRISRTADGLTTRADWNPTPAQRSFTNHFRANVRRRGLSLAAVEHDRVVFSRELGPTTQAN